MKKIYAILIILATAIMFNACSSMRNVPQSNNKLGSPFPAVKDNGVTFVEAHVEYAKGASIGEIMSKQTELKNILRGELAKAIYADIQTYDETRAVRGSGDDEYSTEFASWVLTTSNVSFPGDIVYMTECEVLNKKEGAISYWVRFTTDKKKMLNYYEKSVKTTRKNYVSDRQSERRHEENMAKAQSR